MALPAVSTTASTPEQTSRESTESVVNSTLNAARSEGCEVTERRVQEAAWDVGGLADHANCLLDLGNQTAASRILQQAIALEPNHFESLYALAEIRLGRGDRQGARVLYQQAYQAARGDAQALAARRALRDLSR